MGARDTEEMLEVAKEECGRLERELTAAKVNAEVAWGTARNVLSERDAALAVIAEARTKAVALTCIVGHWRGQDFDAASEFAGEAILEILAQSPSRAPEPPAKPLAVHLAPPTRTGAANEQRDEQTA